jgi:hypothetical protein
MIQSGSHTGQQQDIPESPDAEQQYTWQQTQ